MKERIIKALSTIIEIEEKELLHLPLDTRLSDLGMESIQFIQLIVALEDEFQIEILDSDLMMSNFETIDILYQTIEKYVSQDSMPKKVLICDCDNVLWHGISGEEKIFVDNQTNSFQNAIVELFNRGVLICLCSKNEPENIEEAFRALEMPLKQEHIIISKVNTLDKASNIKEIAHELNLSEDNFVFVDDSEYELDLVSTVIPKITTALANYSDNLFIEEVKSLFASNTAITNRTEQYRTQKEREKEKKRFSSIEEFNASLETEVQCIPATTSDASRIAELSQRTNQFNLSDVRYTEGDIIGFISDNKYAVYVLSARDKYGDMGIVGASVLCTLENPTIIAFFLSCRVFGRDFEKVLIDRIKDDFKGPIEGVYKKTSKNRRFASFYSENGVNVNA